MQVPLELMFNKIANFKQLELVLDRDFQTTGLNKSFLDDCVKTSADIRQAYGEICL